jgi:polysaccharide pyruvyl transferase WcaK-like protein
MTAFHSAALSGDLHRREQPARSSRAQSVRVGLFNVKFSPNLGDGLLSECLEAELRIALPAVSVDTFDLAGRTEYAKGSRLRSSALAVLHHSPQSFRHVVAKTALGYKLRRGLRQRWREALPGLDAVIVGGGNLLSDTDLNFPLKLDAAMAEIRAAGVPAGVFGVGVSDNWSPRGETLFRRAFSECDLYFASVRESRSAEIWRRRLGPVGVRDARVVHDPGVLAAVHFPQAARGAGAAPLIGLGLTHPVALKYHSDERVEPSKEQEDWYVALAQSCLARGWKLAVFTNGSPEDTAYMAQLQPRLSAIDPAGGITFVPDFRYPGELAGFIATLDLLMAHRLHANIVAYSYAIPQIGFSWDVKLKSFLDEVGRSECICDVAVDAVDLVTALAERQLNAGVESVRHCAVLAEARNDVAKLGDALLGAVFAGKAPPANRDRR